MTKLRPKSTPMPSYQLAYFKSRSAVHRFKIMWRIEPYSTYPSQLQYTPPGSHTHTHTCLHIRTYSCMLHLHFSPVYLNEKIVVTPLSMPLTEASINHTFSKFSVHCYKTIKNCMIVVVFSSIPSRLSSIISPLWRNICKQIWHSR